MKLYRLTLLTAVLAVVFTLIGCDEDFSEVGGEIINNPTDVNLREVEVNSYTQKLNAVQTNNLSNLMLGTFQDDVYGESSASIVSQVSLATENPSFGQNAVLDSVVLTLPYYSTDSTGTDGQTGYRLDSIFGSGSFDLKVYETSFFLNNYDPASSFETRQKYYSDQKQQIEQNILATLYSRDNFTPSNQSYTEIEYNPSGDNDTVTKAPALRIKLDKDYFQEKIIAKEGESVLQSNSNFKNYLRSLYIKAEANDSEGVQALLDLTSANQAGIMLYYTNEVTDGDETTMAKRSFRLNLNTADNSNNRFNLFTEQFPEDITQEIANQDEKAKNLFLKGQAGSMAVIDIFPDSTELANLRSNKWLVNEANLKFYVNQEELGNDMEPERVFLYDLKNNALLVDYVNDPTISSGNALTAGSVFSSRLQKGEDERGVFYKLRITQHVSNILNNDANSVKLGLVVTGNITLAGFSATKDSEEIKRVPVGSILTPRGTVLYGSGAENEDKRLKLQIYYTEY